MHDVSRGTLVTQLSTSRKLIYWAEERLASAGLFYGHGTEEPLDEAVFLVFAAAGLEYFCPDEDLDKSLPTAVIHQALEYVETRIATRKPAAYITGHTWFAGMKFYVDERVLIPRSPFAELIESRFSPWLDIANVHRILDMCTGSACIALACARQFTETWVDGVDVSMEALAVASKNLSFHRLQERVRLVRSDLFAELQGEKYDLIVSNPPYVPATEVLELPEEYQYEPALALGAGEDGLTIVKRILMEAADYLTENGTLIVEVGDSQEALEAAYPQVPFIWLEIECGGEGVFLLNRDDLKRYFG